MVACSFVLAILDIPNLPPVTPSRSPLPCGGDLASSFLQLLSPAVPCCPLLLCLLSSLATASGGGRARDRSGLPPLCDPPPASVSRPCFAAAETFPPLMALLTPPSHQPLPSPRAPERASDGSLHAGPPGCESSLCRVCSVPLGKGTFSWGFACENWGR